MKRIIIIIVALFTNTAIAQLVNGTPFNYCTLNGTQYNPGTHPEGSTYYHNMWVTTDEDEALSKSEVVYLRESLLDSYPNHTILSDSTVSYNCHGYSFSVFQGGDTCNIFWFDEFCRYSFEQVMTPQNGDVAVIREVAPGNGYTLGSIHSSVVVNQDTLISKWGVGCLTKHHKNDVIGFGGLATGLFVYTYYRRVINTNDRIYGPATFNGTGSYVFNHNDNSNSFSCTWSVEPAAMFQVSSGSGTTANLSYATPFVRLAPKATITFTFGYGCDNHYTAVKEIDLRIPTTTISGTAISDGFVLDANAVMTVTGQIKSNEDTKAIVPVGTRLVIDGGRMTSNGNVMWQGVEVWGNYFTHQYAVNGVYGQGYIELKNGAVVENALCAVELWKPDDWSATGGIINATGASFINNATAVHALCYTNHRPNSSQETDYNGWFDSCSFVVDGGYLGTELFRRHVVLADVKGVKFSGCHFSADRRADGVDPWCVGINAYDAGFQVHSFCPDANQHCPENDDDRSSFSGFGAGIRASSAGNHPRTFSVREALFNNNDVGVYADNIDGLTVLQNEFTIGDGEYCQNNYGVYLENVSAFCIEENSFSSSLNVAGSTFGVAIQDSYGINDVYKNEFGNLSCGNLAKGENTSFTNGLTTLGLTYNCNTNSGNSNDFMVLQIGGVGGIQPQQGSLTVAAGNTFGATGYQFYNENPTFVDYYYNYNNSSETPSSSHLYHVNRHGINVTNTCRSHYGNGSVTKSPSEKAGLESEYYHARTAFMNLRRLLDNHINVGDPAVLADDMNLLAQMGVYAHDYSIAAGDIVRSNLNDSVSNPSELLNWLGNMNDISADRMAVSAYLQEGDSVNAFALANVMPDRYGLRGEKLEDHFDYIRLMQLYQALHRTKRTVYQLKETEKEMIEDIALNGRGYSKSLSEALLEQVTGRQRNGCHECQLPNRKDGDKGGSWVAATSPTVEERGFSVNVSPNPTTTWTVVDYSLPANMNKAVVDITNALGVRVMSVDLNGPQGRRVLDLSGLPGGVYMYSIRCGEYTNTGKIVITK